MISTEQAYELVMANLMPTGKVESVSLADSIGRVLAEDVLADRDFPPFDRVCMDGIVISYQSYAAGRRSFPCEAIAAAGQDQKVLSDVQNCIEIMTGAVMPVGCDTVIPYEHIEKEKGGFMIHEPVKEGQNIHLKGRDISNGVKILSKGSIVKAIDVNVLATVGKSMVKIIARPSVAVISSGDELVKVEEIPMPYQIRRSNVHMLRARLSEWGISSKDFHAVDDPTIIKSRLEKVLQNYDVIMLSGGVSKGKFDYIPEILEELNVERLFHRVAQKPGKPMWFGRRGNCFVFAFPGNPVSTLACLHKYFYPWFRASMGQKSNSAIVQCANDIATRRDLTRYALVRCEQQGATMVCHEISSNGSGDMVNPTKADGFVEIPKSELPIPAGSQLMFMRFH